MAKYHLSCYNRSFNFTPISHLSSNKDVQYNLSSNKDVKWFLCVNISFFHFPWRMEKIKSKQKSRPAAGDKPAPPADQKQVTLGNTSASILCFCSQ